MEFQKTTPEYDESYICYENIEPNSPTLRRTLNLNTIQDGITIMDAAKLKSFMVEKLYTPQTLTVWNLIKVKISNYYLLSCTTIDLTTYDCKTTSDLVDITGQKV